MRSNHHAGRKSGERNDTMGELRDAWEAGYDAGYRAAITSIVASLSKSLVIIESDRTTRMRRLKEM